MESLLSQSPVEQEKPARPPFADDTGEFAGLYQSHGRAIYYLALRYLGDPQKAEDVTHDVFLKAYKKWGDFRGEATSRTWLYRITINHCCNLQQSWQQRNVIAAEDESVFENAAGNTESPLRVLETKELGQRIQKALDGLSEECRLLLLLVPDEELSYAEVAPLTGQSAPPMPPHVHPAPHTFSLLFPH